MAKSWSDIQIQRLKELGANDEDISLQFDNDVTRNRTFQQLGKRLIREGRRYLEYYRKELLRPKLNQLESALVETLVKNGFSQVSTPIIMSKGLLVKMSIGEEHPLFKQIFWVEPDKCLRPMLAPHLYYLLKDLLRLWEKPVCLFEVGPCFRKESQGSQHSSEFTMLNLVEMGLPMDQREIRLKELIRIIMDASGITDYNLESRESVVYGKTIDIEAGKDGLELGSAAIGPHQLDKAWKINEPWVGVGFGLERLLMVTENSNNIRKYSRSLSYLDGIRLNI
jgi:pyrrolysyl-tRNA synthetase-like protein